MSPRTGGKQTPEAGGRALPPPPPAQRPQSPTSYSGRRGFDSDLEIITRTLSSVSHRPSESLTRIGSGNSGLVRVTSPTPYYRNPNVILAQRESEEQRHQQPSQERPQRQETASQRRGFLHYLNPASWLRSTGRRRRERGQGEDVEQGAQDAVYDEKPIEEKVEEKEKVLQVAVLIQMPSLSSRTSSSRSERGESLPGYEVGVATLPWVDDSKGNLAQGHGHVQWQHMHPPVLAPD